MASIASMASGATTQPDDSHTSKPDYSLYLVTDTSDAILKGRDLFEVVEEAIHGGVKVVQYREKSLDTKTMIAQASKLKKQCHQYYVKLIVNDRVDVAFAAEADGVHLGQDDMDIQHARGLLGDEAIIGISCSTVEEALQAVKDGADYLGIGAIWATPTKKDVSAVIGCSGAREIVNAVEEATKDGPKKVPCIAIGGINASNAQLLKWKCETADGGLDGIAVVSAIMAAESPKAAAKELRDLILNRPPWMVNGSKHPRLHSTNPLSIAQQVFEIARTTTEIRPITHNMTNIVVANFAANIAIAARLSPIMSKAKDEVFDLAKLGGGLVLNIGTTTREDLPVFIAGMQAYNKVNAPVLLDPVGIGASKMRFDIVSELMNNGIIDIIKGNEDEIRTIASGAYTGGQKGVDSNSNTTTDLSHETELVQTVQTLARRERCIVLMTGETDILSDGRRTYAIRNGVAQLGRITGSGCALGALAAGFAAAYPQDRCLAVLTAVLFYEIAAELAQEDSNCHGPGTFVPCLIDHLATLAALTVENDESWLVRAKIEALFEETDSSMVSAET